MLTLGTAAMHLFVAPDNLQVYVLFGLLLIAVSVAQAGFPDLVTLLEVTSIPLFLILIWRGTRQVQDGRRGWLGGMVPLGVSTPYSIGSRSGNLPE